MLLPVTVLLLIMGWVVFRYARTNMLEQWSETVIVKLSMAAHQVDMRLEKPEQLLGYLHENAKNGNHPAVQLFIIQQLEAMDGVVRVDADLAGVPTVQGMGMGRGSGSMGMGQGDKRWMMNQVVELTPPHVDIEGENEKVNFITKLRDTDNNVLGSVNVAVSFDYLIENIVSADWWQDYQAYLVEDSGMILASTSGHKQVRFGDENHPADPETLKQIKAKPSGTILGPGKPPVKVTGFYRLKQAPWTLIVEAPGREVLAPIVTFRQYYFFILAGFVVLVLLVLRLATGRTSARIKAIAGAADLLAQGHFSAPVPVKTHDEVGELTRSFNTMMNQLEERVELKKALTLAMEVQRSLLPKANPDMKGIDIAGRSVYCDETGGDYFDFPANPHFSSDAVSFVVGDVSGHGVSSALLMATARGFIRQRTAIGGNISDIITDVNAQLARDVEDSGQFMTAYCGVIDLHDHTFRWVTAGHDAAIVYDDRADSFHEWGGKGTALGLMEGFEYQEHVRPITPGQIIVVGTDGIWETRNQKGDFFGKKKLGQIIRNNKSLTAEKIIDAVLDEIKTFRHPLGSKDDITLVVMKIEDSGWEDRE